MYRIPAAIHPDIHADTPPDALEPDEKKRLRAAATRVKQLHPGPIGECVAVEILTWEALGYRFGPGTNSLIRRLVDHIMDADL